MQNQIIGNSSELGTSLLDERESGINKLATDVEQVCNLFTDLSLLVKCQGEQLDNIETNISNSMNNVEGANTQLIKSNKYQKARYRCYYRCIGYLVIILIILIFVIVIRALIRN